MFEFLYSNSNINIEFLNTLNDLGFPFNKDTFLKACIRGDITTINWLNDHGYINFNNIGFKEAIDNNRLDVLKWLYDNNFRIDPIQLYFYAINNNDINILNLFKQTFPEYKLSYKIFKYAQNKQNNEIIQWLKDNNCPETFFEEYQFVSK